MYHSEFYKNVVAVTNRSLCERPFLEQIERVCACHPKALILREKDLSEEEYFLLAKEVLGICRQYQVSCILHTYVEAARKLGHPCIHLPLFLLEKYQGKLGDFQETGCSVHSVEDALKAQHKLTVDKKKIQLDSPIKQTGETEVAIKLYPEVATTLKVVVTAE